MIGQKNQETEKKEDNEGSEKEVLLGAGMGNRGWALDT